MAHSLLPLSLLKFSGGRPVWSVVCGRPDISTLCLLCLGSRCGFLYFVVGWGTCSLVVLLYRYETCAGKSSAPFVGHLVSFLAKEGKFRVAGLIRLLD